MIAHRQRFVNLFKGKNKLFIENIFRNEKRPVLPSVFFLYSAGIIPPFLLFLLDIKAFRLVRFPSIPS